MPLNILPSTSSPQQLVSEEPLDPFNLSLPDFWHCSSYEPKCGLKDTNEDWIDDFPPPVPWIMPNLCTNPPTIRDSLYYDEDGDVFIQVEDRLFKLHRADFYNLGEGSILKLFLNDITVGLTEDDSIKIPYCSVEEFYQALKYLFRKGTSIIADPHSIETELQLIRLAVSLFKCGFKEGLDKAIAALKRGNPISSHPIDVNFISSNLAELTELAAALFPFCRDLWSIVKQRWRYLLLGKGRELAIALNVAEKGNRPNFKSLAYYHIMRLGPQIYLTEPGLSETQRACVHQGYQLYMYLGKTMASLPPLINHHASCMDNLHCDAGWEEVWRDTVETVQADYEENDYSGIMSTVWKVHLQLPDTEFLKEFADDPEDAMHGMHPECLDSAWEPVIERIKQYRSGNFILPRFSQ